MSRCFFIGKIFWHRKSFRRLYDVNPMSLLSPFFTLCNSFFFVKLSEIAIPQSFTKATQSFTEKKEILLLNGILFKSKNWKDWPELISAISLEMSAFQILP